MLFSSLQHLFDPDEEDILTALSSAGKDVRIATKNRQVPETTNTNDKAFRFKLVDGPEVRHFRTSLLAGCCRDVKCCGCDCISDLAVQDAQCGRAPHSPARVPFVCILTNVFVGQHTKQN